MRPATNRIERASREPGPMPCRNVTRAAAAVDRKELPCPGQADCARGIAGEGRPCKLLSVHDLDGFVRRCSARRKGYHAFSQTDRSQNTQRNLKKKGRKGRVQALDGRRFAEEGRTGSPPMATGQTGPVHPQPVQAGSRVHRSASDFDKCASSHARVIDAEDRKGIRPTRSVRLGASVHVAGGGAVLHPQAVPPPN